MNWTFRANGAEYVVRTGTVVDVQIWSETYVSGSSSGGGGFVSNGSGYVSSPSVSVRSKVENKQRLFVKWSDGSEATLKLDHSLPFRTGNGVREVRVVKGADTERVELRNLDTAKSVRAKGYDERPLPRLTIGGFVITALLGYLASWLLLGNQLLSLGTLVCIVVLVAGYIGWKQVARRGQRFENAEARTFWTALDQSQPSAFAVKS